MARGSVYTTKRGDDNRLLIGVISDRETSLGFLLAGVGQKIDENKNVMIVHDGTPNDAVEDGFQRLYNNNKIGVLLLGYKVAKRLRHTLDKCKKKAIPIVLVIPTKGTILSYLEEQDKIRRQRKRDAY